MSDDDVYTCQIMPENISMKAKLVVIPKLHAQIVVGDRDVSERAITYPENQSIQVECKVTGDQSNNVHFKWSLNGTRVQTDDNLKINDGILTINKANRHHIGMYQCLADNGTGDPSHASINIKVRCNDYMKLKIECKKKKTNKLYQFLNERNCNIHHYYLAIFFFHFVDTPHVTAHRSIINTRNGDRAELYCVFETSPEYQIQWSKDQRPLQIGNFQSKYSLPQETHTQSVLVVNSVTPNDLGTYECRVTNDIGSEKIYIELTYAPEPPKLHKIDTAGKQIITEWHIRSLQALQEIQLNYRNKNVNIYFQFQFQKCVSIDKIVFMQKINRDLFIIHTGNRLVNPSSNTSRE